VTRDDKTFHAPETADQPFAADANNAGGQRHSISALLAWTPALFTRALPRQSLLKLLDLLFDLLFAVAGRKKDIVDVPELLRSCKDSLKTRRNRV
jgi:hypothetical protein